MRGLQVVFFEDGDGAAGAVVVIIFVVVVLAVAAAVFVVVGGERDAIPAMMVFTFEVAFCCCRLGYVLGDGRS